MLRIICYGRLIGYILEIINAYVILCFVSGILYFVGENVYMNECMRSVTFIIVSTLFFNCDFMLM